MFIFVLYTKLDIYIFMVNVFSMFYDARNFIITVKELFGRNQLKEEKFHINQNLLKNILLQ